jgi:hypothetical protein
MSFQHGRCKKLTLVIAVFTLFFLGFTADQKAAAAAGSLTSASPARTAGTVIAYPLLDLDKYSNYIADPSPDPNISMTVGGTAVNVQDNLGSAQTRFEMSDNPETVVITDTADVTSAAIRPLAYGIQPVVTGDTIAFTLPRPEDFAVEINGNKDALLVFADPLEVNQPRLGDSNVVNVMSFAGVNNDGVTETAALQAAVNYVSAHSSTTPILYFPPGVYRTATLEIGSNAQIYLSSGAVLLADPDESDYPSLPGSTGPGGTGGTPTSAILAVRGATNVKIFGRGVVDGDGYNLYANYGQDMGIFDVFTDDGTNHLTVDDVMFTNSVMWQSDIQGSYDVAFNNVKFNNPQGNLPNQDDGFKVNGAYNVTFRNGWISSRDDTMTFAAVGPEAIYNTSNINMSGTVLDSSGTASASIRFADIGPGQTMSDINVSNIYDISYGRGMTFRGDGGNSPYQNSWGPGIVLNNWDIENPAPLVLFGSPGSANVTISGITISNITMPGGGGGSIQGNATNAWENIHFSNIVVGGVVASDLNSFGLSINSYATGVDVAADSAGTDLAIPTPARPETTTTTSIAPGYSASAATDGDFGTFFKSASSPSFPQDLTVAWLVAHAFSGVTVVCDHCQGQAPTNWNVQVSPNGTTGWTTVGSSGNVAWRYDDGSYESYLVSFPAQTAKGVRIRINSANNEYGQYQIDELEVTPANSAPAATANTTSIAPGFSASAANSGLWDSSFKSATSPSFPQYFTLQWPTPQTVGAVTLVCDHCESRAPTNWDVQASLNGFSNWTTVATSGNVTWTGPDDGTRQAHVVSFSPVTAMALRLQINHANLAGGQYQIDQVETMPASAASTAAYQNRASDLCLDDPDGSTTPNTLADVEGCGGGAQQQFTYNPAMETLKAEGLCLAADGGGDSAGTQVGLGSCRGTGNPGGRWTVNSSDQIVSAQSGLCLQEDGTTSGDQLELESCETSTAQYENQASGLCLGDPDGSTTPSTFGDVETCTGGANQQLTYNTVLQSLSTEGLCMDSYGGGASPGTRVDWYLCNDPEPSQEWTLNSSDQIVSGESGLCLQEDGTTSGDQLELENCDASNQAQIWAPSNQAQQWTTITVRPYANGASSLCLDDPDGSTTPSTFGDVAGCTGGSSQQLTYNAATQTLTDEGLCMDSYDGGASPGTRVDWYTCQAGFPSQEWTLSGNQIVSGESGLCLQEDGTTSGDQLELENCDATNLAQIWAPSTVQTHENRASSLCLDDPGGSTTPSTFADVEGCSGGASQQFTYNPETRALAAEGLCLDSYGGGASPGTRVDLYTCLGAGFPSQQWTLNSNDQIVSGESGLCVQEDGTTSGDQLELENCDASNQAQQWSRRH